MTVIKGSLLFGLTPEDLIGPVGIERRVDINEVDGGIGQLFKLLQIVATVDDPRVDKGGRLRH